MYNCEHFVNPCIINISNFTIYSCFIVFYIKQKEVKACLHAEAEKKIKSAVGFRQVIDLLSSEQKLIVGHNCFLGKYSAF